MNSERMSFEESTIFSKNLAIFSHILKNQKGLRFFFQNENYFCNFLKMISKKILQLFWYSERAIASTEPNYTSKERSNTEFFGAGNLSVWHYQEGSTPTCSKKTLKKNIGTKSGIKKKFLILQARCFWITTRFILHFH